jgi:hypothetical protein
VSGLKQPGDLEQVAMHRTARAVLGLSLLCAAGPALAEQAPPKAESLTSILERIRQDVGYYEVQAAR